MCFICLMMWIRICFIVSHSDYIKILVGKAGGRTDRPLGTYGSRWERDIVMDREETS
jgi:hypothetical protein